MGELEKSFLSFLETEVAGNPMKSEHYLPTAVQELLKRKEATVKVLRSGDKWFGVTYKEDKEDVVNAISELKGKGVYPEKLW